MPHRPTYILALLVLVLLALPSSAFARKDKKRHAPIPAMPAVYKENCGSCHTAYGAYLLPAAAWSRILASAHDHFGTELELDADTTSLLGTYLQQNAADSGNTKLGGKIMRDMGRSVPERISTLPYIAHKHRKVKPSVFALPSVNGLQNCIACHPGAEQGDFDDDRVRVPQE